MDNEIIRSVKLKGKYWWASLVIGILALIVGLISSFEPFATIGMLTLFFITYFLVNGIFEIIFAISNRKHLKEWGWTLAGGIVSFIFATILIMIPLGGVVLFMYYVAFYVLLQALLGVWGSFTLKNIGFRNWWGYLLLAILGVIFGCILVLQPAITASLISIIFAISLICYGLFRIFYAFRLRKLKELFD